MARHRPESNRKWGEEMRAAAALGHRNPDSAPLRIVHAFPGQGDFAMGPLVRALGIHTTVRKAVREVFEEVEEVGREFGIAPMAEALLGAAPPSGRDLS